MNHADLLRPLSAWLATALLMAGCAAPDPADRPPQPDEDPSARVAGDGPSQFRSVEELARVPDAVPQDAPRSRYGNPDEYEVFGETYQVMDSAEGFTQRGRASWYGTQFHGRRTSSGTPYDMYAMTAAHRELPLPTWVEVTNLENQESAVVKVNDRGPFVDPDTRIIDLSYAAAVRLGIHDQGTAPVEIRVVTPNDPPQGGSDTVKTSSAPDHAEAESIDQWLEAQDLPDSPPADGLVEIQTVDRRLEELESLQPIEVHLQAGVYAERGNAERVRQKAEELNASVRIEEFDGQSGPLFRVIVGPFSELNDLERLEDGLNQAGIETATMAQ